MNLCQLLIRPMAGEGPAAVAVVVAVVVGPSCARIAPADQLIHPPVIPPGVTERVNRGPRSVQHPELWKAELVSGLSDIPYRLGPVRFWVLKAQVETGAASVEELGKVTGMLQGINYYLCNERYNRPGMLQPGLL